MVNIGLSYSGFTFDERFNRQFAYSVFEQKRLITMLCCFFVLFCFFFALHGAAFPLKPFYMSLHSNKTLKENMNHLWLFKLGKWNNRHLSGSQTKPLGYRLNMCVTVTVCLSRIAYTESMSFFSNH